MRHSVKRLLPYTPAQIFELVGDVERYPDFVPWLKSLKVSNRRPGGEGITLLDAEADVGFSVIHERFSTLVKLDAPALAIDVDLISGPFRKLENRWRFAPHGAGTQVDFRIDFEFKSRLLQGVLSVNFHRAVDRLIGCFDERAKALYG